MESDSTKILSNCMNLISKMTLTLTLNQQEGFTLAVMHIGAPACGMKNRAIKLEYTF